MRDRRFSASPAVAITNMFCRMRVFLTSDSKAARALLRSILESQGHQVEDPSELGAGALVAKTNWTADAVIAALLTSRPPQQQRAAVLVEIGVSVGRGLPTLVLTKTGAQMPSLSGVPRIDADLSDADTMALKVELFLQGVREGSPSKPAASPGLVSHPGARRTLGDQSGQELEIRVRQVLGVGGSELVRDYAYDDVSSADFALYVPGEDFDLGLVLVEVKSVIQSGDARRRIREAAAQLSSHVMQSRAGLGLLVYDGPTLKLPSTPLVAAISIADLSHELGSTTLAHVLRRARNEAIHGM